MERREFLKLTLGFTAAAGSIAAMATTAAQAAPMLPQAGATPPEGVVKPAETAMQGKAEPAMPDDLNAVEADDVNMSAQRRRFWRRRRVYIVRRRPRRFWRRRRVIYY